MKRVIFGDELDKKKKDAIDLICNAVASTIGPIGNNVLINSDETLPYITNDGVTIAKAIESDDEEINGILDIIKNAAFKTNEEVGDGTSTTLVLVKSLYDEGIKLINNGISPIILKNKLNEILNTLTDNLSSIKRESSTLMLENIASISANDKNLGMFISEIFGKMKTKYAIKIVEGESTTTYYEINKGYNIAINNISPIYFKDEEKINLSNCHVLITTGYLNSLEDISDVINEVIVRNETLIILVDDCNNEINNNLISYYLKEGIKIFIFNFLDYGSRKTIIKQDIAFLSNSKINSLDYNCITFDDLGIIKNVIIKKDEVIFLSNVNVTPLINKLEEDIKSCKSNYDRDYIYERIAKLSNGIATIYVGGNTSTEIQEKMMRIEDAVSALEVANNGVVPGEGVSFLYIANMLDDNVYNNMVKIAFAEPFNKIIENTGISSSLIYNNIKNSEFKLIYKIDNGSYEDIFETKIVDPYLVVAECIKNAISIAGLLLTTKYMIINDGYIKIDNSIQTI